MTYLRPAMAFAILGMVAACSAPAPMVQHEIHPQPTFDKFGGGSCEEGYEFIPGTAVIPPECVPDDGCDDVILADGSVVEDCPEPGRDPYRPPVDDDGPSDSGRDPTGGSSTPGTPTRG